MCSRSFRGAPSIIFFRTKQRAHRLKILFGLLGLPVAGVIITLIALWSSLQSHCKGPLLVPSPVHSYWFGASLLSFC